MSQSALGLSAQFGIHNCMSLADKRLLSVQVLRVWTLRQRDICPGRINEKSPAKAEMLEEQSIAAIEVCGWHH